MVVLIGDFLDVDQVDALPLLAARHEVLCLAVRDPLERALQTLACCALKGSE